MQFLCWLLLFISMIVSFTHGLYVAATGFFVVDVGA